MPEVGRGLIYLDYNATTPVDPRVASVIFECMNEEFGNPSSTHAYGESAHAALARARGQIASLIGASAAEIVFTGSGSEADALAIRGVFLAARIDGRPHSHMITQVTEHPAVLAACEELADLHGVSVTYLPVDEFGRVDPREVEEAITSETFLISIMHANNEIGTLQPIAQISEIAKTHGVLMHSDAAQSVGKIPVNVADLGVDLLTIVGHKMYAPKGIAVLYVKTGVHLHSIIGGGGQENGLRAGTENVASAVGLGEAADLAVVSLGVGEQERLSTLIQRFETILHQNLPELVHVHGHPTVHLPNTINFRIDGVGALLLLSSMPTFALSAGSACHSDQDKPSSVLLALGLEPVDALGGIRLSLGRWSTEVEVEEAAAQIISIAKTFMPIRNP
jgi:cysteine desulfurase